MSKFIPKVGDDCLYSLGDSCTWHKCNIIFIVGTQGVVMESKQALEGVQFCSFSGNEAVKFKPLKTPAEIERDEFIKEVDRRFNCFGKGNELIGIMYDSGYRKQQVKPLSRSYAKGAIHISDMAYNDLVGLGFIVEGGE